MFQSVADPIFQLQTSDGPRGGGLFEVMAGAARCELRDLPGMRAHQRPAVVTVVAVLMHLLARYAQVDRSVAESWHTAWREAVGEHPLRLIAPHAEVAFLQPPTEAPTSPQSLEAADLLLPNVEHEVKRSWTGTAEQAVFALMGSMLRPNAKFHRRSSRVGLTAVLVSEDGSIGGEIGKLAEAYDKLFGAGHDAGMAQHLPWLLPYRPGTDDPLSLAELPVPFLDVGRAQRIVRTELGRYEVSACPNNTARVSGSDPWVADPQTPQEISKDGVKRYKLGAKSFSTDFQHAVMFGATRPKQQIVRPRVLDLTKYRMTRVCALGSEEGKTLGHREALYLAAKSEGLFCLEPPATADRPARLSQRTLATIKEGGTVLYAALAQLHRESSDLNDTDERRLARVTDGYRAALAPASVQIVFDLLNAAEDPVEEQRQLDVLVATLVRQAFATAVSAMVRPLAAARAELRLNQGILTRLKGAAAMAPRPDIPALARQSFAILQEIAKRLSPDDRAQLRTMSLAHPPMSFWRLLAHAPAAHAECDRGVEIWKVILAGMGHVALGQLPFGRALAMTEFPETRASRLLDGSGESLPGLINEAVRWLISHDVKHADLSTSLTLGLADALGDRDARTWARRTVALDFARNGTSRPNGTAAEAQEPVAEEA
jgi:hypothetical protein